MSNIDRTSSLRERRLPSADIIIIKRLIEIKGVVGNGLNLGRARTKRITQMKAGICVENRMVLFLYYDKHN